MACLDFNEFKRFILAIDQKVAIDEDADKALRYNVWETTSEEVQKLTSELSSKVLPNEAQSLRILDKLKGTLKRIRNSTASGGSIQKDIFDHEFNVEMSIGLHEMMESVKGEADKARNLGLDVTSISDSGVLPALPLSRVAASIGRKIAFQKGYRFKRAYKEDHPAKIEAMYYDIGKEALIQLEKQGYVKLHDNVPTIMDYQNKEDLKKDFPGNKLTRSDVLSVSISEEKLKIKPNTQQADYFLNRTDSNIADTNLGVVTEKLRAANMILQPATIVLPDVGDVKDDVDLSLWDDGIKSPDPITAEARKNLHKNPVRVHKSLHGLMQLFNEDVKNTGSSASKTVMKIFGTRKNMIRSLFGLKRSDDFSIDKKESVSGQNLSKTTPLDDLAEYYDLMQKDGNPADLHMQMKIGRNARLYYLNSVLNAHGSKQSRHMLTPGEYTVDTGTADFDYLVYQVAQNLKLPDKKAVQLTYADMIGGDRLKSSLELYDNYMNGNTLTLKLHALGALSREFPGIDYVNILTSLQAVKDIRNPKGGKVTTEFTASSDATASGGTLTFLQALGRNPLVTEFLQRIGILKPDQLVQKDLADIYGLMTEAVQAFVDDKPGAGLGADLGDTDVKGILQDTLDLLFIQQGKDVREFSKDPTMTFVYGQGRNSAVQTLSRSLADRIIDNLDSPKTREYLTKLFNDDSYNNIEGKKLRERKDLYADIVDQLVRTELPGNIFDIMEHAIKNKFLTEYINESEEIYDLVKQLPNKEPFRVLPLGAVLAGKKASNPGDLAEYGMPITKKVEVLNTFEGKDDTVLTRRDKLHKPVMDVSTTHGQDAGLLYHSLADVNPSDGVVVVHDDVRGSVQTVRAMEKQYAKKAKEMALKYDIHQQIMEAIAAQSPEIAASAEFRALKAKIDKNVATKQKAVNELFNEDTSALIGDGKAFEKFANPEVEVEVDTKAETPVKSTESNTGVPLAEQNFGNTFITITEGDESVTAKAQEYWDDLQSRLDMVEELRTCLAK